MYQFRSVLVPYGYSSVWQTHNSMVPLNRSMFIDFSEQKESFEQPQQFMFGDVLLAAPITTPGVGEEKIASQKVWFPNGEVWYDYFTGEKFEGGQTLDISKPLDEFPLFVRGGHVLVMQPYTPRPATTPLEELVITVYPSVDESDNTFTLYEDDGLSLDYKDGKYTTTDINYSQKGDMGKISVKAAQGGYDGQIERRSYKIRMPKADIRKSVKVNGKVLKLSKDKDGIPFLELPKSDIRKPIVIEFGLASV